MGQMIELTAADGFVLSAYRADPVGTPRGGIVVVQEIFGVNSHIRGVCDGYAADGYRVVAPALFDRYERGVDVGYTPEDIAKGIALKGRAGIDAALLDVAAARAALAGVGNIGVIGYCWGGYVAWMAAARLRGLRLRRSVLWWRAARRGAGSAALPGDGAFRRARQGDSGGRGQGSRQVAPGSAGVHLRGRSRLQLRPARILRCAFRGAGARADPRFLPAADRLSPASRRSAITRRDCDGSRGDRAARFRRSCSPGKVWTPYPIAPNRSKVFPSWRAASSRAGCRCPSGDR